MFKYILTIGCVVFTIPMLEASESEEERVIRQEFQRHDLIIYYAEYNPKTDAFSKREILRNRHKFDSFVVADYITKGRAKDAENSIGYLFVSSKGNPQIGHYAIYRGSGKNRGKSIITLKDHEIDFNRIKNIISGNE